MTDAGWQSYHGLRFSVQRRSAGGLTTNANYTVATCEGLISQGQSPLNVGTGYQKPVSLINPPSESERQTIFADEKGRCGTWRKHILNITASLESPRFDGAVTRAILSGWRLSGIFRAMSGSPLTVVTGADRALSGTQATTLRANQVGRNPYGTNNGGWLSPTSFWLNPTSFAQPAIGTYGTSVRNAYDGPGLRSVDLSLVRSVAIGSGQRIEARVEAFNAFNWVQPGNPNTTLSAATFGRITTLAGDPRIMQFAMKYKF